MNILCIEDLANSSVAPYLEVKERDLFGREGYFIAEGKIALYILFNVRLFEAD